MYVLATNARLEEKMKAFLENSILKPEESIWIPTKIRMRREKHEWYETREAMLPGYLLLETSDPWGFKDRLKGYRPDETLYLIGRAPRQGDEESDTFREVTEQELEWIRQLSGEMSRGVKEGDRVRVTSGPLVGLNSYIISINRHKKAAKLRMPMFDREIDVWVALEVLSAD